MNNLNIKNSFLEYFPYLLVALFPILSLYTFLPIINLGYFFLILLITLSLIKNGDRMLINLRLFITMTFLMIMNLVVGVTRYIDVSSTINNTLGMLVFTFIAIFLCNSNFINKEKLYKASKLIGLIATLFLLYQFISQNIFGITIRGQLSFLTPIEEGFFKSNRPTSFFSEPAHFAIYIAPIYLTSLVKREYAFSALFFLGLILSGSTSGMLLAIIFPFILFLKGKEKLVKLLFGVFGIFLLINVINNYYVNFFEKLTFNSLIENVRIFGSLEFFNYLNSTEWLFGLGLNRLGEFLLIHGHYSTYNYANAYFFSILSFGIIGGTIWIIYTLHIYKYIMIKYKTLYFLFVFISFSDQILFNRNLLYLLIWIYAFSYKTIKKEAVRGGAK